MNNYKITSNDGCSEFVRFKLQLQCYAHASVSVGVFFVHN